MKQFEYEFHSADYHLLIIVATALRNIIGHLLKLLDENSSDCQNLETFKALKFVLIVYESSSLVDVLKEIGVENPSPSHLQCLEDLPLTATYSCLKLFLRWVDEGYYDYCTLPFPFKVHLSDDQQHAIEEWKGSTIPNLKEELSDLIKVLKHSQQDITCRTNAEAVNVRRISCPFPIML